MVGGFVHYVCVCVWKVLQLLSLVNMTLRSVSAVLRFNVSGVFFVVVIVWVRIISAAIPVH